jgi:hypothetical protein
MNMPGFDAESWLGPTIGLFRGKAGFGGSGVGELSMQWCIRYARPRFCPTNALWSLNLKTLEV